MAAIHFPIPASPPDDDHGGGAAAGRDGSPISPPPSSRSIVRGDPGDGAASPASPPPAAAAASPGGTGGGIRGIGRRDPSPRYRDAPGAPPSSPPRPPRAPPTPERGCVGPAAAVGPTAAAPDRSSPSSDDESSDESSDLDGGDSFDDPEDATAEAGAPPPPPVPPRSPPPPPPPPPPVPLPEEPTWMRSSDRVPPRAPYRGALSDGDGGGEGEREADDADAIEGGDGSPPASDDGDEDFDNDDDDEDGDEYDDDAVSPSGGGWAPLPFPLGSLSSPVSTRQLVAAATALGSPVRLVATASALGSAATASAFGSLGLQQQHLEDMAEDLTAGVFDVDADADSDEDIRVSLRSRGAVSSEEEEAEEMARIDAERRSREGGEAARGEAGGGARSGGGGGGGSASDLPPTGSDESEDGPGGPGDALRDLGRSRSERSFFQQRSSSGRSLVRGGSHGYSGSYGYGGMGFRLPSFGRRRGRSGSGRRGVGRALEALTIDETADLELRLGEENQSWVERCNNVQPAVSDQASSAEPLRLWRSDPDVASDRVEEAPMSPLVRLRRAASWRAVAGRLAEEAAGPAEATGVGLCPPKLEGDAQSVTGDCKVPPSGKGLGEDSETKVGAEAAKQSVKEHSLTQGRSLPRVPLFPGRGWCGEELWLSNESKSSLVANRGTNRDRETATSLIYKYGTDGKSTIKRVRGDVSATTADLSEEDDRSSSGKGSGDEEPVSEERPWRQNGAAAGTGAASNADTAEEGGGGSASDGRAGAPPPDAGGRPDRENDAPPPPPGGPDGPRRRRPPHPTALAFFAYLDGELSARAAGDDGDGDGYGDEPSVTSSSAASSPRSDRGGPDGGGGGRGGDGPAPPRRRGGGVSGPLLRASRSLGWRNRHSQAGLYPVRLERSDPSLRRGGGPVTYSVRQVQRGETDGTYGTGATVWPASVVLLKYMESIHARDPGAFRGAAVADLGAGTAVASVAAAAMGARLVVCTDGCGPVVDLAAENVRRACEELRRGGGGGGGADGDAGAGAAGGEAGGPSGDGIDGAAPGGGDDDDDDDYSGIMIGDCELRVRRYWWGENDASVLAELSSLPPSARAARGGGSAAGIQDGSGLSGPTPPSRRYDIILVSDCVLPKLYPIAPLVHAISALSGPQTMTYLSYEHRHYPEFDPRDKFRELAEGAGLEVRVVPGHEQHPIYSVDDIEIWEIQRTQQCRCDEGAPSPALSGQKD